VRRIRKGVLIAATAASLLAPAAARAGEWALMFDAGLRTMSNSPETEKAIFGDENGIGFGLGLTYDHGARWRFGADVRRIDREGEWAFAADRTSEAFRMGHPLSLGQTQGLATVAFRFGRLGPVSPYVGVGAGVVSWNEESDTAGLIEKASGTSGVFEARLGIERDQGPVRFGIEGGITFGRNAIGAGGISKVYEETDLGGLFVVGKIGFTRK
jgi:opacity protein-like surface antigen